jgi:hypothetical protein
MFGKHPFNDSVIFLSDSQVIFGELDCQYTGWGQLRYRIADFFEETAWNACRENLQLVSPHVSSLINELDEKSVITADHGNTSGDRQAPVQIDEYGHTGRPHLGSLTPIPWLVVDDDTQRTVASEQPSNQETETVPHDKLEAIGMCREIQ